MNKVEYKAFKKTTIRVLGADDKESLEYYAEKMAKIAKIYKWIAIALFIASIPLSFIIIGIPLLFASIFMYFFAYRKMFKKVEAFREHIKNDPDLAVA